MSVDYQDTLEPVGILGGLFVIVMGLVALLEAPWATSLNSVVSAIQLLGIAIMILVGLGLMWLSYTGDALEGLSSANESSPVTDDGPATAGDGANRTADDETEEEFGVTPERADESGNK